MAFGWRLPNRFGLGALIALSGASLSFAAGQPGVPAWLEAHVGEGDGQIAPVVLERARALYQRKLTGGAVRNPCYFAMDATRPHDLGDGRLGRRFYIICEAEGSFRAIPDGSRRGAGSGRSCGFFQRTAMREKLRQRDGFRPDRRRRLCDGRDHRLLQGLLSRLGRRGGGSHARLREIRRRRGDCER